MVDDRPDPGPEVVPVATPVSLLSCACECKGSFGGVEGGLASWSGSLFSCGCLGGGGGGVLGF